MNDPKEKPWYKQAWPWFVFSIPALTVVAGIITFQIAADKPHSMVQDDYFKKGLAINQSLAKEQNANQLGLVVAVIADTQSNLLSAKFTGEPVSASQVQILFSHPTKENLDKIVILDKLGENEFIGELPKLTQANWYIRLVDKEDTWLLKSRWQFPADKVVQIDTTQK